MSLFGHALLATSLPFRSTFPSSLPVRFLAPPRIAAVSATLDPALDTQPLTAKEKRQLRNEMRQSKAASGVNWREEVEQKLLMKNKNKGRKAPRNDDFQPDDLGALGPQWWILRVSQNFVQETAERLPLSVALKFPGKEFKIYAPTIKVKRRLKNGSTSVKLKSLFPGCLFVRCELSKELHDFIKQYYGVGGFVGTKVGRANRRMNKPRPVSAVDMEAVMLEVREEQKKNDQAFQEAQLGGGRSNPKRVGKDSKSDMESEINSFPEVGSQNASNSSASRVGSPLVKGSKAQVVSGTFAGFEGKLQKVDGKEGKATIGLTVLGKEASVELDINQIVAQTN